MTDQHPSQQQTGQLHGQADRDRVTHGVKRRLTSPSWLARAASVGLCSISIGFLILFVFVVETGGNVTLFTRPLLMQIAVSLPAVIMVLTAATTIGAGIAWWNRYWSIRARIHQSVLALLGLGFSWQLTKLGFLPL